jgi:hypothetical protein
MKKSSLVVSVMVSLVIGVSAIVGSNLMSRGYYSPQKAKAGTTPTPTSTPTPTTSPLYR